MKVKTVKKKEDLQKDPIFYRETDNIFAFFFKLF